MKKGFRMIACAIAAVSVFGACGMMAACGKNDERTVVLTGSTSVQPLMEQLAAAYEAANKDVSIVVSGGGSGVGISDAEKGACDIGMVSRALKSTETSVTGHKLCDDGIVLIVKSGSDVTDVTNGEIFNLYANGTAFRGINEGINRKTGSGTRDGFNELVLNPDETSEIKSLKDLPTLHGGVHDSTSAVVTEIAASANKIGYISLGSLAASQGVQAVSYNGTEATVDNVKNKSYSLQRPFYLVTKAGATLSDDAQDFLDFVLGADGQAIVTEFGCVAL